MQLINNNKFLLFAFALVSLFNITANAQTQRTCGTDDLLQSLIDENPAIAQNLERVMQEARDFNNNRRSAQASIVIPVVVHVFHDDADASPGQGTNISDAQIISQIEVLNEDFTAQNADIVDVPTVFQNVIGDLDVEFRMAEFDEQGNSTNGITRNSLGANNWNDNLKPGSIWDPSQYLNVWVTSIPGGTLGYATFPGTSPNGDGVVVDYKYYGKAPDNPFNTNFDLGRTATHEIGHWLGLFHTFNGSACDGNTIATCTFSGDRICDTPPIDGPNYGCNFNPNQNTCTETPNDLPDMWMNYMDYSNDACLFMFTEGQVDVMLGVLNTSRASIKTSSGITSGPLYTLSGVVKDAVTQQGVPNAKVVLRSPGVRYEITCDANGQFSANNGSFKEGTYEIYAGKWGYMTKLHNTGFDLQSDASGLEIEINPGIYYDDFLMDFDWTVTGDALTGAWERGIPIGTTFNGQPSNPGADVESDFGDMCYVTGNGGGQAGNDDVDDGTTILISPVFDLSNYDRPYISYYRWFFNDGGNSTPDDEMSIRISNGSDTLTFENLNFNTPNSNSWRFFKLDLLTLIQPTSNMRVWVEISDQIGSGHIVEGGFDKFMVVDSANLPTSIYSIPNEKQAIKVYPNPSSGSFMIDWENKIPELAAVKVYSMSGKMVWSKYFGKTQNSKLEVNTQNLSSGLYILEVFDGENISTTKIGIH